MRMRIAGYDYYDSRREASKAINKRTQRVAHEGGLGWYVYDAVEYARNPRKRIFGF